MNANALQRYQNALGLPDQERAELAARLIENLPHEADDLDPAAWDAEIRKRIEELDNGSVTPIPWPEARRMILEE